MALLKLWHLGQYLVHRRHFIDIGEINLEFLLIPTSESLKMEKVFLFSKEEFNDPIDKGYDYNRRNHLFSIICFHLNMKFLVSFIWVIKIRGKNGLKAIELLTIGYLL